MSQKGRKGGGEKWDIYSTAWIQTVIKLNFRLPTDSQLIIFAMFTFGICLQDCVKLNYMYEKTISTRSGLEEQ